MCFALMDYHHIGQLYEQMVHLPELDLLTLGAQKALHQHYTPTHLATRLLDHLPLERIRPENRVVFDPAAGSGSLLLAATRRLAAMTDLPLGTEAQRQYLSQRVVGNDLDPQGGVPHPAQVLTKLHLKPTSRRANVQRPTSNVQLRMRNLKAEIRMSGRMSRE